MRGWLAASLAQAGRTAEAAAALDAFLRTAEEDMGVSGPAARDWERFWQDMTAFQHRSDLEHLLEGLRKAGLPE